MQTLSYGFQKPQTGDKGSVFFPALESDLQQLNDHTHNGTNSAQLTAASSVAVTQSVGHAGWASQGNGTYKQTVTMPGGITWGSYAITFLDSANGRILLLTAIKQSASTYDVYINDNTLDVTAVYT